MSFLKQSRAFTRMFLLVQSSDHITGLAGASPTVTLSKAGGSFASAGGTVTEVSSGWYKLVYTTTDTNTLGDLAVHITAASGDPRDFTDQVVAVDFEDSVRFGMTTVPNAAAGATGGLPVVDSTGAAKADVTRILGTTLTETVGGYLAAAYKKLFDVATPVLTAASVNQTEDIGAAITELTTEPGTTPTIRKAVMWLYMGIRNGFDLTAGSRNVKNNAGTPIASATLSDDNTTFTQSKYS